MKRLPGQLKNMLFLTAGLIMGAVLQPAASLPIFAQQAGCQTFHETGKTVCGRFLDYWQSHGGLSQQGYPISNPFTEVSELNGKTYTVQYFERAVFEVHPENQPPNDVLLSQLGTFQFKRKYPTGDTSHPVQSPLPNQPTPTATEEAGPFGPPLNVRGNFGQPMRVITRSAQEGTTIAGNGKQFTAKGKFVVLYVTVTNLGDKSDNLASDFIRLQDDQGRRYPLAEYDIQQAAQEQFHRDSCWLFLGAGLTAEEVIVVDAEPNAANYRLVPTQTRGN